MREWAMNHTLFSVFFHHHLRLATVYANKVTLSWQVIWPTCHTFVNDMMTSRLLLHTSTPLAENVSHFSYWTHLTVTFKNWTLYEPYLAMKGFLDCASVWTKCCELAFPACVMIKWKCLFKTTGPVTLYANEYGSMLYAGVCGLGGDDGFQFTLFHQNFESFWRHS